MAGVSIRGVICIVSAVVTAVGTLAFIAHRHQQPIRSLWPLFLSITMPLITISMGVLGVDYLPCARQAVLDQVVTDVSFVVVCVFAFVIYRTRRQTQDKVEYGGSGSPKPSVNRPENVRRSIGNIPERSSESRSTTAKDADGAVIMNAREFANVAEGAQIAKRIKTKAVSRRGGIVVKRNTRPRPVSAAEIVVVAVASLVMAAPAITSIVLSAIGGSTSCGTNVIRVVGVARTGLAVLLGGVTIAVLQSKKQVKSGIMQYMVGVWAATVATLIEQVVFVALPNVPAAVQALVPYFTLNVAIVGYFVFLQLWKHRYIEVQMRAFRAAQDNGGADQFASFLRTDSGFEAFRQHLIDEFSVENLLFYKRVEEYNAFVMQCSLEAGKDVTPGEVLRQGPVLEMASMLYYDFLHPEAPLAINLSSPLRAKYSKIFSPVVYSDEGIDFDHLVIESNLFDPARDSIIKLMMTDSFFRFKRTERGQRAWVEFMAPKSRMSRLSKHLTTNLSSTLHRLQTRRGTSQDRAGEAHTPTGGAGNAV
ncbi:unnamed protein product (mitochondrion) [Plasmodiophora brassicae]|uniref:RGS domain-containing protein n=1 Tax=Plasmodiophora brassicae TaxID=37360 RepID=A0A3P3Y332_PLABS|nr:unnamed protein product [Plasmodiophora brassicae]